METILTLTMNPAVDVSSSVPNVFPEHKLRCGSIRNDPGGGGINVARVIHRLGASVTAWHCSGGVRGLFLRELLDREEVSHLPIEIAGETRENITILETATGQQYRFVMPGPTLSEHEWKSALRGVRELPACPRFVVASGSLPPGVPVDFYGQLATLVSERGGRLILDTSGPALKAALQAGVYLAKPSLRELRELAASNLEHEAEQDQAAMELVKTRRCEAAVVSLGAAGVLVATGGGCVRFRAPTVAVRSRVGAGDSMLAGIVVGLQRGKPLHEAVHFGLAAGAAAVMNTGTELCHRADVEHLFGLARLP